MQVVDILLNMSGISSKRILAVDDEPFVCESVKMMLMFDGHQVETAASGYEALEKFDAARFDLVVTDYAMPGMKGDQLAQTIKKQSPQMPVILLTAFPPETQPACFNLVLTKPFSFDDLRNALVKVDGWNT